MSKLAELRAQYAWVGQELQAVLDEQPAEADGVRFFISEGKYPDDGSPFYFATGQLYSYRDYVDGQPTRSVAGTVNPSLQLLDQGERDMIVSVLWQEMFNELEKWP